LGHQQWIYHQRQPCHWIDCQGWHKWLVEILWSGPTGDIKFEAENITAALAFVKGVEKTFEAFTGSEAP